MRWAAATCTLHSIAWSPRRRQRYGGAHLFPCAVFFQKQIILYIDSGLENDLGELIIPNSLVSGDFTFYVNAQEFFPKIQSNEQIHFITLNFTGSGSNVIVINGSEYLSGLTEIVSIENKTSEDLDNDFLPPDRQFDKTSFDDYLVWLIVGGVIIVITVFTVTKFLKNKN